MATLTLTPADVAALAEFPQRGLTGPITPLERAALEAPDDVHGERAWRRAYLGELLGGK